MRRAAIIASAVCSIAVVNSAPSAKIHHDSSDEGANGVEFRDSPLMDTYEEEVYDDNIRNPTEEEDEELYSQLEEEARRNGEQATAGERREKSHSSSSSNNKQQQMQKETLEFEDGEYVNDTDYGNHNTNWEDGHASWEEFGHNNEHCNLQTITVQEWEDGKYWEKDDPVLVTGVTEHWAANTNWKLSEMLDRYGDAEATMGDGRRVGEIGPDGAGNLLEPTTVKEFITKHMYNPFKYFFDRKIAIPKGMLEDCHPFPMPTRKFLEDPLHQAIRAPSKKAAVDPRPEGDIWMDHLAIAIGSDLQGLSFHHHGAAWNTVIFGKKRWIMYGPKRWQTFGSLHGDVEDPERHRRVALAGPKHGILPTPEWIRKLYPDPFREHEIHTYGHDCIQNAGEMMFVPRKWMHMVVNIGDTVSVISEVGLEIGEGKKPEDFTYDPHASSDDSEDSWDSSDDNSYDSEDEIPNDFIKIDTNRDGRISRREAKAYFKEIGRKMNLNDLWEMDDEDNDGYISFDEFSGPKGFVPDDSSDDSSDDYLAEE